MGLIEILRKEHYIFPTARKVKGTDKIEVKDGCFFNETAKRFYAGLGYDVSTVDEFSTLIESRDAMDVSLHNSIEKCRRLSKEFNKEYFG